MLTEIPDMEFKERTNRIQNELKRRNLDALFVFSTESEPANVRYLSNYWPNFEMTGVLVPLHGGPILIIGPESETFARSRSKIKDIRKIIDFRVSSLPEYPGVNIATFDGIFKELSSVHPIEKLGVSGYTMLPVPVYRKMKDALKGREPVICDDILLEMRMIKSNNELDCLREAYRITEKAWEATLGVIKPGMTELEISSEAEHFLMWQGAEETGFQVWCCSGPNSNQAISRSTHRKVQEGELIQMEVGARVGGYSSAISRTFVLGSISGEQERLLRVGLNAEALTIKTMKPGIKGKDVQKTVHDYIKKEGFGDHILYGPAHGIGLMECEGPYIEATQELELKPNMTFNIDIWLSNSKMGLRFERGVAITESGIEVLSDYKRGELIILR